MAVAGWGVKPEATMTTRSFGSALFLSTQCYWLPSMTDSHCHETLEICIQTFDVRLPGYAHSVRAEHVH